MHKRIVQPLLETLEGERAQYFQRLVQRLEEDRRVEPMANLVYLTLKETLPFLPIYLEVSDLAERLIVFVAENKNHINRAIFDRSYISGDSSSEDLHAVTNKFVTQILAVVLEKYDDGEVAEEERKAYRFSGDFDTDDFPYQDLDD